MLDLFASLLPDFPKGKRVQGESPDFIVHRSNQNHLGIELTKYFQEAENKNIFPDGLQQRIDAKNMKLQLYRSDSIQELWLVIALGLDNSDTSPKPSQSALNHSYISGFQSVFLVDIKGKKLFELDLV